MTLTQIGFHSTMGPLFMFDDGTLPSGKKVLVRIDRDANYNKVLAVLMPSVASFLQSEGNGEFPYTPDSFVLGSYVPGQVLNLTLASFKYPNVVGNAWTTGYKAIQSNWAVNNRPFAGDGGDVSYSVQEVPKTDLGTVNMAPEPGKTNPIIFVGLAFLVLIVLGNQNQQR